MTKDSVYLTLKHNFLERSMEVFVVENISANIAFPSDYSTRKVINIIKLL